MFRVAECSNRIDLEEEELLDSISCNVGSIGRRYWMEISMVGKRFCFVSRTIFVVMLHNVPIIDILLSPEKIRLENTVG